MVARKRKAPKYTPSLKIVQLIYEKNLTKYIFKKTKNEINRRNHI